MKKLFIVSIFILCSAVSGFAADWQAKSVTHESAQDDDEFVCLKDSSGNIFFVEDGLNIPEEQAAIVIQQKDLFFGFKNIKQGTVRFYFENGILYTLLAPSKFEWDSVEVSQYIPAGMLFSYENGSLLYNFRVKKDSYFIRVNGAFISEKVLCDKVVEAVKTPQTYVQRRDPDYLLSHFDQLVKENELLKKAVIGLNNRGFFSNDGPVDDKIIARILTLKTGNSKLTPKETEEILKKENFTISSKAVELVFNVYFNEFSK